MEAQPFAATSDGASEGFQPATSFEGARQGYCFKLGEHGLGYYLDLTNDEIGHRIRQGELSNQALFMLAHRGSFRQVEGILAEFPDRWQERQRNGATLLHWAAFKGEAAFAQAALDAGHFSVDEPGPLRQTPLHWAVVGGQAPLVRLLLGRGADMSARDEGGATPLVLAATHGQRTALCQLVAQAGPDAWTKLVCAVDDQGRSAAHWAAYNGEGDILKLLARFGADFYLLDTAKCTPLHRAVQGHRGQVLEFLVERGVDPLARNAEGQTCIDIAQGCEDCAGKETHKVLKRVLAPIGVDADRILQPSDVDIEEAGRDSREERQKLIREVSAEASMRKLIFKYRALMGWIACVSLSVFEYTTDVRQLGWRMMPWASLAFEVGVVVSLALFFYVMKTDPGRVPIPPSDRAPGVEAMLRALREGKEMDANRLCTTTWILKGLRTKYCAMTKICVREFDHYCDFTACPIGQLNHRQFFALLLIEPMTQACHLWILAWIALDSNEGIGWPSSLGEVCTWHMRAAWRFPLMAMVSLLHAFSLPFVMNLVQFQAYSMCFNVTGNEVLNRARYSHFWVEEGGRRTYVNPFCKGSMRQNVVDFWCDRRRSEAGPGCPPKIRELTEALREAGAQ